MAVKTLAGRVAGTKVHEVAVEAVVRGSFNSRIGIIHVDPSKKAHPDARRRMLPVDVAQAMKAKGLVKIKRGMLVENGEDVTPRGRDKAEVGLERRQRNMDDHEEHPLINSGGDTRDTTAFATDPMKNTGSRANVAAAALGAGGPDTVGRSAGNEGGVGHDADLDADDNGEGGDDDDGDNDGAGPGAGDAPPSDEDDDDEDTSGGAGDAGSEQPPVRARRGRKPAAPKN